VFFYTTRGCGCGGHPAFPAPSDFQGERIKHRSGVSRRGIVEVYLAVIASGAKQSILPREERMDCFVASLLAMTKLAV
jgi:hypothetical protein